MALGPTHYRVKPLVRRRANALVERYGGTWNTYLDHPTGYHLDDVSVDFWGEGGRGVPIGPARGQKIVDQLLATIQLTPVAWIIWRGRAWRPHTGWRDYPGWLGLHMGHVHCTFNLYSNTAGAWPSW